MDNVPAEPGLMTMVSMEEPVMLVITLVNVAVEVITMIVYLVMTTTTYITEPVLLSVQMVSTETQPL